MWFAKAGEAVQWFRWRSVQFVVKEFEKPPHIEVWAPHSVDQGAILLTCQPGLGQAGIEEVIFDGSRSMEIAV